jgi:hypothetical protein
VLVTWVLASGTPFFSSTSMSFPDCFWGSGSWYSYIPLLPSLSRWAVPHSSPLPASRSRIVSGGLVLDTLIFPSPAHWKKARVVLVSTSVKRIHKALVFVAVANGYAGRPAPAV